MMKGKNITYIMAILFATLFIGCDNGYDCYLENTAYDRIGFYRSDSSEVKYEFPEALTVSLMVNGKDSIVVNHIVNTGQWNAAQSCTTSSRALSTQEDWSTRLPLFRNM